MTALALSQAWPGTFGGPVGAREATTVVSGSLTLALFLLGQAPTSNSFPQPVQIAATSVAPPLVIEPAAQPRTIPEAVMEMRRLSGLTWDELAGLFDVTRRAVHHWANGSSLKPEHIRQVHEVLRVLRVIARPSAEETRAALLAPLAAGRSAADLLKAQDFDGVVALLGAGHRPIGVAPELRAKPPDQPHPTAFLGGLQDRPVIPATASRVARTIRTAKALDPQ